MDTLTHRYGCNNTPRPTQDTKYIAQQGWTDTWYDLEGRPQREPVFIEIKHAMSTDCKYDNKAEDTSCAGCKWGITNGSHKEGN